MRIVMVVACLATMAGAQEPTPFAPGSIPDSANVLSPAFAPDCRSVLYTIGNGGTQNAIVTSRAEHGTWSDPAPAEFSGRWRDLEAAMAPNGNYVIFASNRPATDGGAAIDGN